MNESQPSESRAPAAPAKSQFPDFAKWRDAVLAIGGIIYVVGYATWCIFAWRTRLGPIPALEAQYFVAGIPVTLIILGVTVALQWLFRYSFGWWPWYLLSLSARARKVVLLFLNIVLLACGVVLITLAGEQVGALAIVKEVADTIGVFLFLFIAITRLGKRRASILVVGAAIWVYAYVSSVGNNALGWFIERGYRSIPQALGGGKPRRAVIELKVTELSPEVIAKLSGRNGSTPVVVSREVWVLARFGDSLFVTITDPEREAVNAPRFELKPASISGIVWHD